MLNVTCTGSRRTLHEHTPDQDYTMSYLNVIGIISFSFQTPQCEPWIGPQ